MVGCQIFYQYVLVLSCYFWVVDDEVEWYEDFFVVGWFVYEYGVEWEMVVVGIDIWVVVRNQCVGNVDMFFVVEQFIWIVEMKGQVKDGVYWSQCDVVFVLVDLYVEDFFVLLDFFVNDVVIGN